MDSSNSESVSHSRRTHTQIQEDQLDRCEQVNEIKARIKQLQKNQAQTRQRKQKFIASREQRLRMSRDVSLSISNNASAIFSTAKSRRQLDQQVSHYESIATITQQENDNLKKQNQYLLEKLKRMKEKEKKFIKIAEKAHKYKQLYQQAMEQLQIAKEQCEVYKAKAEEMKKIALLDVGKLENKILPFIRAIDESDSVSSEVYSRDPSRVTNKDILTNQSSQM